MNSWPLECHSSALPTELQPHGEENICLKMGRRSSKKCRDREFFFEVVLNILYLYIIISCCGRWKLAGGRGKAACGELVARRGMV